MRTGEEYWFHNATRPGTVGGVFSDSGTWPGISFGQIYDYESPNQHGGFPYLWSTWSNVTGSMFIPGYGLYEITDNVWDMYDAFTGNYICSINHVPSSSVEMFGADTSATGKDGSLLIYRIVDLTPYGPTRSYYLQCWNSSRAIWYKPSYSSNEYWMWRPYVGTVFDGNNGYSLNVSLAGKNLPGTPQWVVGEEIMVGKSGFAGFGATGTNDVTAMWAISLKPGQEGNLLWSRTYSTNHMGHKNLTYSPSAFSIDDGYFSIRCAETMQEWVYSLATGELVWGPTPPSDSQYDFYSTGFGASTIADGKLLYCGMGGVLRAWDIKTGKALWNYSATSIGFDSPYGANYPISLAFVADGKAYLYSSEHSPSKPAWRGAMLRCVNLTDGKEIWTITHWGNGPSIADGYIVDLNAYDNRIYCYGKGPSATTVTAPPKVSVHGDSVLIEGYVTDQCAGAKALAEKMGYVNGVPAIADADQKAWMEYLYMQRPCPTSATGVDVTLDALDPNGNFVHIGTVTSDMSGMFKKMFVPEVPGEYTIIATFAGSKSYGSSYAQTAIGVEEAPPASPPPEYPQPFDYTMHFVYAVIAIIIAIAIVGLLILRKK
ncbi:MAG: hypothetical protein NWE94_06500 [Candidatus Bathyarchaeota archaeon]|nr:hypothetical protein [Candidatus Bathyarchaeota archaeon]